MFLFICMIKIVLNLTESNRVNQTWIVIDSVLNVPGSYIGIDGVLQFLSIV